MTRSKASESQSIRMSTPENRQKSSETNSRAIVGTNVETFQTIHFNSALEAKESGFSNVRISECVNGKRKEHRGYTWRYA